MSELEQQEEEQASAELRRVPKNGEFFFLFAFSQFFLAADTPLFSLCRDIWMLDEC